jgi:hypothetical protein
VLKIKDDLNPRNSEPLTVEFSRGKVSFATTPKSSPVLSTDIATFSALFWGAISPVRAASLGLAALEGGDISFLEEVFRLPAPVCLDKF